MRVQKTPSDWNSATVTNNIIANNIAGWDGAGISLEDALAVNIINNTIVSNDATATAGVLFNTPRAALASPGSPPPHPTPTSPPPAPHPPRPATKRNHTNFPTPLRAPAARRTA